MKWIRENLRFAIFGLAGMFRTETSAQLQALAATGVLIAGFFFKIDRFEWIAMIFSLSFVIAAEAFNTALENLADAVHPDRHPLVGKAKDVAAGAVLIAAIAAVVIGLIVFAPKLISCLRP